MTNRTPLLPHLLVFAPACTLFCLLSLSLLRPVCAKDLWFLCKERSVQAKFHYCHSYFEPVVGDISLYFCHTVTYYNNCKKKQKNNCDMNFRSYLQPLLCCVCELPGRLICGVKDSSCDWIALHIAWTVWRSVSHRQTIKHLWKGKLVHGESLAFQI